MKEYDSVEIADAAGARVALGLSEHDEYFRPWTEALGLLEAPFNPWTSRRVTGLTFCWSG
ncbi:hypothetical protein ACFQ7N_12845 [Streptomyces niveus]|uniref:hypothetical protein n=1 Tax=Streptomyces niveus TaxID=193462 RepID=UPI0036B6FEE3